MNAVVQQKFGAISARFQGAPVENDLSAGVQGGYGHISYKGKVWSSTYRGEHRVMMRDDGDGARGSIEVVILKAASNLAKVYYENGYVEGSTAPPDCFSNNGTTPDPGAQRKQSATCLTCPKGAWGSRITPDGGQGKACSDSKRLAVVPLNDIPNELLGGPMLLRVPAASLRDMASFSDKMAKLGYPYYSIGVRIGFDPTAAYPKFVFNAMRPLTDDEAGLVLSMRNDAAIGRILAEGAEHVGVVPQGPGASELAQAFEQPPVKEVKNDPANVPYSGGPGVSRIAPRVVPVAVAPVGAATQAAQAPQILQTQGPATVHQASPAAVVQEVTSEVAGTGSDFEAALDSQLEKLLG